MEDKIIEAYKEMLISGVEDINPYTISQKIGISEKDFFQSFTSADDVGRKIWSNLAETVLMELGQSEIYNSYPARQKVLSYFFTFFELARTERTFILRTLEQPKLLTGYISRFKEGMADVIQEGIATEDIKERIFSSRYPTSLWNLHLYLLKFWAKDESEGFVETEKAIEIYAKVPLELMGPNLLDSIFDSVKFAVQNIKFDKLFSIK